jgi:hypothetical protein
MRRYVAAAIYPSEASGRGPRRRIAPCDHLVDIAVFVLGLAMPASTIRVACLFAIAAMLWAFPAWPKSKLKSMIGEWRGSYVCAQGITALTLSIDKETGETFSGYFHFYPPPPRNPKANEGCYSVEGHRSANGRVVVTAVRWIFQPPNYVTVDLEGELAAAGLSMSGDVRAPPPITGYCHRFALKWRDADPKIAPICKGELTAQVGGEAQ